MIVIKKVTICDICHKEIDKSEVKFCNICGKECCSDCINENICTDCAGIPEIKEYVDKFNIKIKNIEMELEEELEEIEDIELYEEDLLEEAIYGVDQEYSEVLEIFDDLRGRRIGILEDIYQHNMKKWKDEKKRLKKLMKEQKDYARNILWNELRTKIVMEN